MVCCGTTSLRPSSAEIVVLLLRFIAYPPLPSRVPDNRALPIGRNRLLTMTRTEGEAFQSGRHSVLRLSYPAGRRALIVALTWTNATGPGTTTLMQFSVSACRLHSL